MKNAVVMLAAVLAMAAVAGCERHVLAIPEYPHAIAVQVPLRVSFTIDTAGVVRVDAYRDQWGARVDSMRVAIGGKLYMVRPAISASVRRER